MVSPKTDYSDYETMYKRHVHDNLILNDDLRLLDSMKKSKLKELNRDKAAFKKRLLPKTTYSKQRGTLPDIHYSRNQTPRPYPKPSYVVCKDSPCSLKTWNNLTDVSETGIDVYKTGILESEERPLSFRSKHNDKEMSTKADDQVSYMKLPKSQRGSREIHTAVENYNENHQSLNVSEFRNRSSTLPSFSQRPRISQIAQKSNLVSPLRPRAESYDGYVSKKTSNSSTAENDGNVAKAVQIDVNIIPPTEEDSSLNTSSSNNEHSSKSRCAIRRARSFTSSKQCETNTRTFRPRSYTLETEKNIEQTGVYSGRLLKRRQTISLSDLKSTVGLRHMSLVNQLANLGLSLNDPDRGSEDDLARSYESLVSCRYLRVPGQNIDGSQEDISLEKLEMADCDI